MENIDIKYIITAIGSIIAWLMGKKFFLPFLSDIWDNIKGIREIKTEIKETELSYTDKQFSILLNQIQLLEDELKEYSKELQRLRNTILELNSKLVDKQLVIMELQSKCCDRIDCPNRIACKNYVCNMIEEEQE